MSPAEATKFGAEVSGRPVRRGWGAEFVQPGAQNDWHLTATLVPTERSSGDGVRLFTEIHDERRENEHKLKQLKFLLDRRRNEDGKVGTGYPERLVKLHSCSQLFKTQLDNTL